MRPSAAAKVSADEVTRLRVGRKPSTLVIRSVVSVLSVVRLFSTEESLVRALSIVMVVESIFSDRPESEVSSSFLTWVMRRSRVLHRLSPSCCHSPRSFRMVVYRPTAWSSSRR